MDNPCPTLGDYAIPTLIGTGTGAITGALGGAFNAALPTGVGEFASGLGSAIATAPIGFGLEVGISIITSR